MKDAKLLPDSSTRVLNSCRDGVGIREATLGHVFAAAATASELSKSFFHERAHVEMLTGGLCEDYRRLRRGSRKQCQSVRREACELLRKQLEEGHLAIGEGAHYQLATICFWGFGEDGRGLGLG